MESIWERILRLQERQEELERDILAQSRERVALEQLLVDVDTEEYRGIRGRQEVLANQQDATVAQLVEHRGTISQLTAELHTESDEELDTESDDTEYTDVSFDGYRNETCLDDGMKIKMICTCDWCNVKEENLF